MLMRGGDRRGGGGGGGESRPGAGATTGGPEAAGERQSVGVEVAQIRAIVAELLGPVSLEDALAILLALLDREAETFPRAAARWQAGASSSSTGSRSSTPSSRLAALATLPGPGAGAGAEALIELSDRYGAAARRRATRRLAADSRGSIGTRLRSARVEPVRAIATSPPPLGRTSDAYRKHIR